MTTPLVLVLCCTYIATPVDSRVHTTACALFIYSIYRQYYTINLQSQKRHCVVECILVYLTPD